MFTIIGMFFLSDYYSTEVYDEGCYFVSDGEVVAVYKDNYWFRAKIIKCAKENVMVSQLIPGELAKFLDLYTVESP